MNARKLIPVAGVLVYWAAFYWNGSFRVDHWIMGAALLLAFYVGPRFPRILSFSLPVLLVGVLYDSQRLYGGYIRGPIHVAEPYLFDRRFFGIPTSHGVLTPNEWWQLHTHPVLDLISGFCYLGFIAFYVLIAAYFVFWVSRKGTKTISKAELLGQSLRMNWAFFWLNLVGYSTYYWYAAAPPWYVAGHGLGPVDLTVQASPAGAARFDLLLGTHFFTGMYGRAADVFGAVPSLHVSYPLLAAYFAFRFGALRIFTVLFYFLMCFSAVYLNHHYVFDILWGSAYALIVGYGYDTYCEWRSQPAAEMEVQYG